MTQLSDFDTEDRAVLTRAPNALVMATAYSEHDGVFSIRKELKAGLQAAIDGATAFPDNQIVQQLAIEMNSIEPERMDEVRNRASSATEPADLVEERDPTSSRPTALQLAARALAIMATNTTQQETVEFKYWLYSIADQVTLASKAGGFLGFGGTRVSPAEAAFLADLRRTLDIPDENVPSATASNTQIDDVVASNEQDHGSDDDTDIARIAELDAASAQPHSDTPAVAGERPEDV